MEEKEIKEHKLEKIKTANVVAVIIVLFCAIFLVALLFINIPDNNRDIVNFLAGTFYSGALGGVIFFFYNFKKDNKENTVNNFQPTETIRQSNICENCKNEIDGSELY